MKPACGGVDSYDNRCGSLPPLANLLVDTPRILKSDDDGDGSVAPWSWYTMSFVHCSNMSGVLNDEIVALMTKSSFTVLEKYQCLPCAPEQAGAEGQVLAAAKQIRAVNPKAPIISYFAVDYTRRWYDLKNELFCCFANLHDHRIDLSIQIMILQPVIVISQA